MQGDRGEGAMGSSGAGQHSEGMLRSRGLLQSLAELRNSFLTSRAENTNSLFDSRSNAATKRIYQNAPPGQDLFVESQSSQNSSISTRMPFIQFDRLNLEQNLSMKDILQGKDMDVESTPCTLSLNAKSTRIAAYPPSEKRLADPLPHMMGKDYHTNHNDIKDMNFLIHSTKRKNSDELNAKSIHGWNNNSHSIETCDFELISRENEGDPPSNELDKSSTIPMFKYEAALQRGVKMRKCQQETNKIKSELLYISNKEPTFASDDDQIDKAGQKSVLTEKQQPAMQNERDQEPQAE
eukprot:603253-Hanusia_phi.AAC.1